MYKKRGTTDTEMTLLLPYSTSEYVM